MRHLETSLLEEIEGRVTRISQVQHELARQKQVLIEARTQLRLGRPAPAVIARIEEECPSLVVEAAPDPAPAAAPPRLRSIKVTGPRPGGPAASPHPLPTGA
jgi:hypothetical protein